MLLPKPLFDRYGAMIGLDQYPLTEPGSGRAIDPYDPVNLDRYLPAVKAAYLDDARRVYDEIAAPLLQGLGARFFNIGGSGEEMATSLSWKPLPEGYKAGDKNSPLQKDSTGSGDGTVPFWSAFHASTPDGWCKLEVGDHLTIAENKRVLKAVERLINGDKPGDMVFVEAVDAVPDEPYGGPYDIATAEEVDEFLKKRPQGLIGDVDPRTKDPRIWRRIMHDIMM